MANGELAKQAAVAAVMDLSDSPQRAFWVQVFTEETWRQFLAAGATTTGFRDLRWKYIQKIKPGDWLLCYVSVISKWVGILEAASDPYLDTTTKIWREELFPCRVDTKVIATVSIEDAVPIKSLKDQLSIFKTKNWGLYLVSSPAKWTQADAEAVVEAISCAGRGIKKPATSQLRLSA